MSKGKTSVNDSTTPIITASERRAVVITNPSTATETLWLAFDEDAVVGEGVPLAPAQAVTASYDGEFNLPPTVFATYSKEINGIYATETNDVPYHTF